MMTTIFPTRQLKAWLTHNLLQPTVKNAMSLSTSILRVDVRDLNTQLVVGLGCTAAGLGALALARKWRAEGHTFQYLEEVFSTDCGIATDHLEEGYGTIDGDELETRPVKDCGSKELGGGAENLSAGASEAEAPKAEELGKKNRRRKKRGAKAPEAKEPETKDDSVPEANDPGAKALGAKEPEDTFRGVAKLSHSPVEVSTHRRVKRGHGMKYLNCVLTECKNKFGTPAQSEANSKAIMRYANNIMSKHGLRPSHVRKFLPMIVSMTFVPSKEELEALAMLNSVAASSKKIEYLLGSLGAGFTNVN